MGGGGAGGADRDVTAKVVTLAVAMLSTYCAIFRDDVDVD